ncbi:MAG: membrane protein insertion efficiency factor YidD [Bacteroidia bacterium]|nr:membrane protein insertion efficiency factor YidD [Bacteroidia bacterium]
MTLKKTIFTIILFLSSNANFSYAQSSTEIYQLKNLFVEEVETPDFKKYVKHNTNELAYLLSGMFLFYKNFISSQDGQTCSFTPSCSEYGIQAVKKKGFLGIFNTFDRLTRCHGFYRDKYPIHLETHLQYDPL